MNKFNYQSLQGLTCTVGYWLDTFYLRKINKIERESGGGDGCGFVSSFNINQINKQEIVREKNFNIHILYVLRNKR